MKKKWAILGSVFFLAAFICLCIGRYPIHPDQVIRLLLTGPGGDNPATGNIADQMKIFWNIRVPRVIMAVLAGAGISTAGAVFYHVSGQSL